MVTGQLAFQEDSLPSRTIRPIVNISRVQQLSPLRYPGGKTWLVPEIRAWLNRVEPQPRVFVEPFAGGGIASLTAVMLGHTERAVMAELDSDVAALWNCILEDTDWLIQRILSFQPDRENIVSVLNSRFTDPREVGFQTLLRNRTQRGGILASGAGLMKDGENGRGVSSRWYAQTLVKRIARINGHKGNIEFIEGDGFSLIEQYRSDPVAVFFIDPPYTASTKRAGKRLYNHNVIDHDALFDAMVGIRGDFLMTYDEDDRIVAMARAREFSIDRVAMKNTHHNRMVELLIMPPAHQASDI